MVRGRHSWQELAQRQQHHLFYFSSRHCCRLWSTHDDCYAAHLRWLLHHSVSFTLGWSVPVDRGCVRCVLCAVRAVCVWGSSAEDQRRGVVMGGEGWVDSFCCWGECAPDSFFCWVGYLCIRKTSKRGPVAGRSYFCWTPSGAHSNRWGLGVGKTWETFGSTVHSTPWAEPLHLLGLTDGGVGFIWLGS